MKRAVDHHLKVLAQLQRLVRSSEAAIDQSCALMIETRLLLKRASDVEAKVWGLSPTRDRTHD